MAFTGKATFSAGAGLPELVEDVGDIVGILSPHETALLDHLGDPKREAMSTIHEWVEDQLVPNTDRIDQTVFSPDATTATAITVDNGSRFRPGDQVRPVDSAERLLVTAVSGNDLTVTRGYGGTTAAPLVNNQELVILGNAELEGAERSSPRFTNRTRQQNYTQIFTETVEVSGSMLSTRKHAVLDEIDYQKQLRLREMMRNLENTVINGVASAATPWGSGTVRRTMNGLYQVISSNVFEPDDGFVPAGDGPTGTGLTEGVLNGVLRNAWERSAGSIDTILVGGAQKRRINQFIGSTRGYDASDVRYRDMVSYYESDFGVCRVVLSRFMPADEVLFLDSSRIDVMPLAGRSFQFRQLAATGDSVSGQLVGEYTLEARNENAHARLTSLDV